MPFIGECHCLGVEVLVGQRGGMAVDAGMLLAAPHAARAAADLGAALLLGAVFVAGRTCALGRLGRLSVPAFRIGERTAGEDAKTGEQGCLSGIFLQFMAAKPGRCTPDRVVLTDVTIGCGMIPGPSFLLLALAICR